MSLTLPPGDILETPPGYPFEEINYEEIEVEEVSGVFLLSVHLTIPLLMCLKHFKKTRIILRSL